MYSILKPGLLLVLAVSQLTFTAALAETLLHNVYGLGFTPDGKELIVPVYAGLAVYRDGRWSKGAAPDTRLHGFSTTKSALYSSGHASPGATLRNLLGLVKSTDGGRSWRQLGLSGEADLRDCPYRRSTRIL